MPSSQPDNFARKNGTLEGLGEEASPHVSSLPHSPPTAHPQCLPQCLQTNRKAPNRKDLRHSKKSPFRLIQDNKKPGEVSNEIDAVLLEILTSRVRVLSVDQIRDVAGGTGTPGLRSARRRMERLERYGWIKTMVGLAHPELPLEEPVATWKPGNAAPEFGSVSYRLRTRWSLPPKLTRVAAATEGAGIFCGGSGGRVPRTSELTHDICLARVFLRFFRDDPTKAKRWTSEAGLYEQGEGRGDKLPDALVITRGAKTAIEFGGAYRTQKLREFHDFCSSRGFAYEIW